MKKFKIEISDSVESRIRNNIPENAVRAVVGNGKNRTIVVRYFDKIGNVISSFKLDI